MKIAPFATEHYFAKYEFTSPYLLSVSDCETVSVGELLSLAGISPDKFLGLTLGYTNSQGHPELREAVASTYQQITADQLIILGSPVEGIYLTIQSLVEPGDQVIVLTPAYDALINVAEHLTPNVRRWGLIPTEAGWSLDFDALEAWLSEETRLVIVNFPQNPTGFLPTKEDFLRLIEMVRQSGSWLYCDEIYRGLEYQQTNQLPSAADVYDDCIVLGGLSKSYGLPGLRSGWLTIPNTAAREAILNWKHYTSICPPAPSERLALAALQLGDSLPRRSRAIIRKNLEAADGFFQKWEGFFTWRQPQAGSVALVGIDVRSTTDYCHDLAKDAGILLLPGKFLGSDEGYVRFGFGRKSFIEALSQYDNYLSHSI